MDTRAVEIVGGGLAGLALGVALARRGVAVTLCEAGRYPRHRVCGDCIAGGGPALWRVLGIEDCLRGARLHRHIAWYRQGRCVLERTLPQPALGLSRWQLDARLAEAFEAAGGRLETGRRVARKGAEPAPGQVDACGRKPVRGGHLGLALMVRGLPLKADLELHFGPGGYCGAAATEDGWIKVCGLFAPDVLKAGRSEGTPCAAETLLSALEACQLRALAERLRHAEPWPGSACAVAGLSYQAQPIPQNVLRIGDAGGLTPPFTGNGMAQAFQSAALAIAPLQAYACGRIAWPEAVSRYRRTAQATFTRPRTWARTVHPWLLKGPRQALLAQAARRGCLPFGQLYTHLLSTGAPADELADADR